MRRLTGKHLMLDAYVSDPAVFVPSTLIRVCKIVVAELGMTLLGEPIVLEVPSTDSLLDSVQDEGGISVIVPITTSHLSIHAWPLRSAMMMDVFSCRSFDADHAVQILKAEMEITDCIVRLVDRKDPRSALPEKAQNHSYFPWNR